MGLEQAFECPATLAKLRSGLLGTLLEGYCDWLLEQGFSRGSARRICRISPILMSIWVSGGVCGSKRLRRRIWKASSGRIRPAVATAAHAKNMSVAYAGR